MTKRVAFQRRHYKAIANIIARARARARYNDSPAEVVADLEQEFVDLFQSDNARFSPSRFIAAANAQQVRAA